MARKSIHTKKLYGKIEIKAEERSSGEF